MASWVCDPELVEVYGAVLDDEITAGRDERREVVERACGRLGRARRPLLCLREQQVGCLLADNQRRRVRVARRDERHHRRVGDAQTIDLNAPLRRPAAEVTDPPAWLTSLDRIADPSLARPLSAAG